MFSMKQLFTALGVGLGINLAAIKTPQPKRTTKSVSRSYGKRSRTYEPNGQRECARRRRQLAAGILQFDGS